MNKSIIFFVSILFLLAFEVEAGSIKSTTFMQDLTDSERTQISNIEKNLKLVMSRLDKLEKTLSDLASNLENLKNSAGVNGLEVPSSSPPAQVTNEGDLTTKSNTNLSEKQEYDLALSTLKGKDYKGAARKFESFTENFPNSPLVSNAYFWRGEALMKQNIYDKAAMYYLKSYKHSSKGAKAPESLFKLSKCLNELKKNKEACAIIAKLEEEFHTGHESTLEKAKKLKSEINCK
ncbi:MAG: tol-pal system protein YbgF [Alphaproteobacteria bacterium]|nr:tol-pal system protein YbgF [Alphaproteobacteria bacterium]